MDQDLPKDDKSEVEKPGKAAAVTRGALDPNKPDLPAFVDMEEIGEGVPLVKSQKQLRKMMKQD